MADSGQAKVDDLKQVASHGLVDVLAKAKAASRGRFGTLALAHAVDLCLNEPEVSKCIAPSVLRHARS